MTGPCYQRTRDQERAGRFAPVPFPAPHLPGPLRAHRAVLIVALAASCAAGLTACGGSDSGKDGTAAAAVSQSLINASTSGFKPTVEQAGCIGTATIKAFGIKKAVSYGLLTSDLQPVRSITWTMSAADADTYAALFIKCADPAATIKAGLMQLINPATAEKRQAVQACLDKNLTPTLEQKVLATGATGNTADTPLTPVYTACSQLG